MTYQFLVSVSEASTSRVSEARQDQTKSQGQTAPEQYSHGTIISDQW